MPASYQSPPPTDLDISPTTVLSCVVPGLILIYHLLAPVLHLPPLWEALFIMLPGAVLGPAAKERLEHAFGQTPGGMVARVRQRAASLVGGGIGGSILSSGEGLVGGLWNVGNTCYQNSVLQAMASLSHLKPHLQAMTPDDVNTASGALSELLATLNELSRTPRVQTPAAVIVRGSEASGWTFNEQQDAQEFFQNLTGSLEKEVARVLDRRREAQVVGLEGLLQKEKDGENKTLPLRDKALQSPFEGLLAQRVGCLKCGYVESISLQPFTTLSLSLPSSYSTTLANCLRAFTEIEKIPEVDCDKCTLITVHSRLTDLFNSPKLSDSLRPTIETRIKAVEEALDDDNFTPTIPGIKLNGAHKVSSTKTKHIMIARPPPVLVIHTNRSQFDMLTGIVGKNYAAVEFPAILDLAEVGVVTSHEELCQDPGKPITAPLQKSGEEVLYKLKAVVAHYGAHHNGHYVCYRETARRWFRISDHEV
jgi:ubiquitin carboxyl-terminal hydrolase 1